MRYLVFQLYGPMASWGEPATGEIRRSAAHPTRSAILGMLAAALGVRRGEAERQTALRDGIVTAVKQFSPGVMVQDYHTAQVPGRDPKAWRLTRRDELSGPKSKLHTVLSTREYRCEGYWRVAVRTLEGCPWGVEALADALRRPVFPLFLGRKSCPPAAPLAPKVVDAEGARAALATPFEDLDGENHAAVLRRLGIDGMVAYAWEGEAGDLVAQETRYPYDEPLNRARWQFTSRPEHRRLDKEDP